MPARKTSAKFAISRDLEDGIQNYMESHGYQNQADAIRALCWAGIAATMSDGILRAARENEVTRTKRWLTTRVITFLSDMIQEVKMDVPVS